MYPTSQEQAWTVPPPSSKLMVVFLFLARSFGVHLVSLYFCFVPYMHFDPLSFPFPVQLRTPAHPLAVGIPGTSPLGFQRGCWRAANDKTCIAWAVTDGCSVSQQRLL